MPKRLFLLDGMALAYRAHFAFIARPIRTSQGLNTSALFGFVQTLLDIIDNWQPTHLAVAFDTEAPTARHQEFPAYKAQRQEMPEDLSAALPHLRRFLDAFQVRALALDGYEADDLIGTLVRRAEPAGFESFMVTPDKDFGQLVTDRTLLWKPGRQGGDIEILKPADVCRRWGLRRVGQLIDLLGLMGDASDNLPGVPGIGEKTAAKLIAQFGSLEATLEHAAEIKGKVGEALRQHADQARLCKRLATILTDAPLDLDLDELRLRPRNATALQALCVEFEFNAIGRRLFGDEFKAGRGAASLKSEERSSKSEVRDPKGEGQSPKDEVRSRTSENATPARRPASNVALELDLFGNAESVPASAAAPPPCPAVPDAPVAQPGGAGFQPAVPSSAIAQPSPPERVTSGLRTIGTTAHQYDLVDTPARLDALVARLAAQKAFCLDTETNGLDPQTARLLGLAFSCAPGTGAYVPAEPAALAALRPLLANPDILKIGHNLKFDLLVLRWNDLDVRGPLFDTMIAHALLEPEQRHTMDYCAEVYLGYSPIPLTQLIGPKGPDQRSLASVPVDQVAEYSAEDADVTWQLHLTFLPRLRDQALERVFYEVEMPALPALVAMEFAGIRVDAAVLGEFSARLAREMAELEATLHRLAGRAFNVNSNKQLGEVLFDELRLVEKPKRTATGQYATDESTLQTLAGEHEIVRCLLEYRTVAKLKSTYADALPAAISPRTGRIHTTFYQAATATGRLSSQDPNLQNIPIRTERGQEIRRAFVAPPGPDWCLLSADYSQIELRLIADISRETSMIEAFHRGEDIHTATAARVFGVPPDQVTPEQRRRAKTVNFGIIYGISAFGLAQRLGLPRKEAAAIIDHYFASYPGIRRYMDETIARAREEGYVKTLTGRRRRLPDLKSANATVRAAAERNAINTPIQGSAADLIKLAMGRIHAELVRRHLRTRMLLQVHDELVFDLYRPEEAAVRALVAEQMKTALPLTIPLEVELGTGANWLEAH
ncbi:MAG: DNA polymerase I [Verrucomicrobiales bacterium]|nr:DNA polymerase I [Verrucomicrobiales bacterium]